jgi:hypothetical protein
MSPARTPTVVIEAASNYRMISDMPLHASPATSPRGVGAAGVSERHTAWVILRALRQPA